VDKQTAERLACLIAVELVSDTARVEEIVERESLVEDSQSSEMLHDALTELLDELLDRSDSDDDPGLKARYDRLQAELEQPDHTDLIARLRQSSVFGDDEPSE
jgi:hypothetical protein